MTRRLSDQLRASTRAAHQRLEGLDFILALADGTLSLDSYVGYLRALAIVHAAMEHLLSVDRDQRIAAVWHDGMRRLPALQQDLDAFAQKLIGDSPAAHQAAQEIASRLRLRSGQRPLSMLGYLYVFEGSILGAAVLGPQVARTFALPRHRVCAYLSHDPAERERRWDRFKARLDDPDLTDPERKAITDAAFEAYAGLEAVLRALHPIGAEPPVLKAASLNPEAGTHPITQDPLELEAVRRAGERSLRAVPYFNLRYGARGHRFAESNGAWLVTLAQQPQARLRAQVAWLAQVLAARGIPRILLQRHLEWLCEELCLQRPESQAAYSKLLAAANEIAQARRAALRDEVIDRVASRFDQTIGETWRDRLPGAGMIIAAAVVDEHAGLVGALDSVRSWFTDEERFPADFIGAVDALVAETWSCLGACPGSFAASPAVSLINRND